MANTVEMRDGRFDPIRISVEPGETVVWENADDVDHDVTSVGLREGATTWNFTAQTLRSDGSVAYEFDDPGVYEYFCSVHGKTECGAVLVGDASLDPALPCEES